MAKASEKNIDEFIKKVKNSAKGKLDLSSDEDLSIAIMNLVSIEEHLFFTNQKTGKDEYLDLLKEVREMRKELLKKIIKEYEGEVWCISKHLLAASMRLMEVGTKLLGQGKEKEAKDLFAKSYSLYSYFWGLNLKLINIGDVKKIDGMAIDKHDQEKKGFSGKLGDLVKKVIDCCIE
jgi:DNA-binding cell septation regulator SpoVG